MSDRRHQLAEAAALEFEDKAISWELVLVRLNALPPELREVDHDDALRLAGENAERCRIMADSMRAEAKDAARAP